MQRKHKVLFLLIVMITPVVVLFYMNLHKEMNRKKVTVTMVTEEEEQEEESSHDKENEKFEKAKYPIKSSSVAIFILNRKKLEYIHFSEKVLLYSSDCVTPPPKIS